MLLTYIIEMKGESMSQFLSERMNICPRKNFKAALLLMRQKVENNSLGMYQGRLA